MLTSGWREEEEEEEEAERRGPGPWGHPMCPDSLNAPPYRGIGGGADRRGSAGPGVSSEVIQFSMFGRRREIVCSPLSIPAHPGQQERGNKREAQQTGSSVCMCVRVCVCVCVWCV